MSTTTTEKPYVLGTHDEEVKRLGFQHQVWRDRAAETWRKAGFKNGDRLLDMGCGPGYVTLELSRMVGDNGQIMAIDRSRRFLDVLESAITGNGISNIITAEADVQEMTISPKSLDGAWSRWVLSFTPSPEKVLEKVANALKPGAVFALHEYLNYSQWRMLPRSAAIEHFTDMVIKSWSDQNGDADVAAFVLPRLKEMGFTIRHAESISYIVTPDNPYWQWAEVFFYNYLPSLVDRGYIKPDEAEKMKAEWKTRAESKSSFMHTPSVMEIVAVKN